MVRMYSFLPIWSSRGLFTLATILFLACTPEPSSVPRFVATQVDSGATTVIDFSTTPSAIALNGLELSTTLDSDLTLDGRRYGFAKIADVKTMENGTFAVLDRMDRHVSIYDAGGQRLHRFGRDGDGPGEFRHPLAIAVVGDHLVVWQAGRVNTFTTVARRGRIIAAAPPRIDANWNSLAFRQPNLFRDQYQMGPEDVTVRIWGWDDSTFVHAVQPTTDSAPFDDAEEGPLPYQLIRYNLTLDPVDTVAVLASILTLADPNPNPRVKPNPIEPMYGGRPLWAASDDWFAVAHGDSNFIRILTKLDRVEFIRLRWASERRNITHHEKLAFSEWQLSVELKRDSEFERQWSRQSSSQKRKLHEEYVELNRSHFASTAPHLTSIYSGRNCLFLAGFRPADSHTGVAATWLAFNVTKRQVAGVFRIPDHEARVRDITDHHVYTTVVDNDGLWRITRYSLQQLDCSNAG